jgi:hypothetical protein
MGVVLAMMISVSFLRFLLCSKFFDFIGLFSFCQFGSSSRSFQR